ncbi:MAG: AI-2E family transporter [Bacteroidota bacterium]
MAEKQPQEFRQRAELVLIGGGVVLLVGLLIVLYQVGFLHPFLLALAGGLLLFPVRTVPAVRGLFLAGGSVLLIWIIYELGIILVPFVITLLGAFLLNPVVGWLNERARIPRWASSLGLTLLTFGLLVGSIVIALPALYGQLVTLVELTREVGPLLENLAQTDFFRELERVGLINYDAIEQQLTQDLPSRAATVLQGLVRGIPEVFESIGSVLEGVTLFSILPVLFFYMLNDYDRVRAGIVGVLPKVDGRRTYMIHVTRIIGQYTRAMFIVVLIAGLNVSFWCWLLDVPFPFLIGVLAAVLSVIPNLGAILTLIVAVLIAAVFGDPWYIDVALVVAILLGHALIEQSLVTPRIMSDQVGVHPVLVLLALFTFGYFFGLIGLLIAVPATALLQLLYQQYRGALVLEFETNDG